MRTLVFDQNMEELKFVTQMVRDYWMARKKQLEMVVAIDDVQSAREMILNVGLDLMIIAFPFDDEKAQEACLELARMAKKKNRKLNMIFISDDGIYAKEGFDLDASGYMMRPVTVTALSHQFECLRFTRGGDEPRVRMQCFGNFEVFVDGNVIPFRYSKTKELLAYLVDRHGACCAVGELVSVLWQDDGDHISYFKSIRKDLYDRLMEVDCQDLIIKQKGRMGLNVRLCSCDYYEWENGKLGRDTFQGEYMSQYSWSEYTTANLQRKVN